LLLLLGSNILLMHLDLRLNIVAALEAPAVEPAARALMHFGLRCRLGLGLLLLLLLHTVGIAAATAAGTLFTRLLMLLLARLARRLATSLRLVLLRWAAVLGDGR
jgi:hypothetical protein